MKVLVACEYSGRVREAFRALGHDAMSCDLQPSEDASIHHHQGDVLDVLDGGWDIIVAHPPCTYLCNSGVQHLHTRPERWERMREAAQFFRTLWHADARVGVCVENPIPHRYAVEAIGDKYTQIVHPYQHGEMERKATCLWLRGLPRLAATDDVYEEMLARPIAEQHRMHRMPDSKARAKKRSLTYQGIADAMASQWGRI